jgi:inosose dehydratase
VTFPERITYVHLKQVDPEVRERVRAEQIPLADAVKLGAMPALLDALAALDADIYAVIEQDLYPVEPDIPLPIGARTAGYYVALGLGPVRRWPY